MRAKAVALIDDRGQIHTWLNVASDGEVVFRLLHQPATSRVKL
jgi:hypothetical protein